MRRAAKRDDNQGEIVQALRQVGADVVDLASVGKGIPDLLVGYRGRWLLLEVKDGRKPPSARKLTPDQERFRLLLRSQAPIETVKDVAEALKAIGEINV